MKKNELITAPLGEATLILVVAAAGWVLRAPMVFTSLGPTAYELIEQPEAKSARPYNVISGHLTALASGFAAVWLVGAWSSPAVSLSGTVTPARLWAAVVSVLLTTVLTLAIGASQPASLSTTLLVSLGSMQNGKAALSIIAAVLLLTAVGEPVRRRRQQAREKKRSESQPGTS